EDDGAEVVAVEVSGLLDAARGEVGDDGDDLATGEHVLAIFDGGDTVLSTLYSLDESRVMGGFGITVGVLLVMPVATAVRRVREGGVGTVLFDANGLVVRAPCDDAAGGIAGVAVGVVGVVQRGAGLVQLGDGVRTDLAVIAVTVAVTGKATFADDVAGRVVLESAGGCVHAWGAGGCW